jgi:hypothetical protein
MHRQRAGNRQNKEKDDTMNATSGTKRFRSSRLGKTVVTFGFAVGLALGAAVPVAADNPFQGEGMRANGQDMEQSRLEIVAAESISPVTTYLPCEAGEGLIGPRGTVDPCMVIAAATTSPLRAYYTCEAGEGLRDTASGPNPCRIVGEAFSVHVPNPVCGSLAALTHRMRYSICEF